MEEFWEWFARQGGDVEGWKEYIEFLKRTPGHELVLLDMGGSGLPKALRPIFEQWRTTVDDTPSVIIPEDYIEAATEALNREFAQGGMDDKTYAEQVVDIEAHANFPTIKKNAPYYVEAVEIDKLWVYELDVQQHLNRKLELGQMTSTAYRLSNERLAEVMEEGVFSDDLPFLKEIQNPMSVEEYTIYKKEWFKYQDDLKKHEKAIATGKFKTETDRLEGQQVVAEAQAKVRQIELDTEFELGKFVEAEFDETLAPEVAPARRTLIGRPFAPGQEPGINIGSGEDVEFVTLKELARRKQRKIEAQEQLQLQRQEEEILAQELPEGFKRFGRQRDEIVDPGVTKFMGFTKFVEEDPVLKERLTELRTKRLTKFPQLTLAFQRAPFEERKKGFPKFLTATSQARARLEEVTRPRRTTGARFRSFGRR